MEISEVRVKLVDNKDDRLKAFCSVTMDNEFVVRDIKIIEGSGGLFVAMVKNVEAKTISEPNSAIIVELPSRKIEPRRTPKAE